MFTNMFVCYYQGPFQDLVFDIIGDESAPQYFSINAEGRLNVARNLTDTNLEMFHVSHMLIILYVFIIIFCIRHLN